MIHTRNNKRFNIYASAEIDGVFYLNFVDEDIQRKLGIVAVEEPEVPEDFSFDSYYRKEIDDAPYIIYEKKPQDVFQKEEQGRINQRSLAYLAETDWMVLRFMETGEEIPNDVKVKRQSCRYAIK